MAVLDCEMNTVVGGAACTCSKSGDCDISKACVNTEEGKLCLPV